MTRVVNTGVTKLAREQGISKAAATKRMRIKNGMCGTCGVNPISKDSKASCEGCMKKDRERKEAKAVVIHETATANPSHSSPPAA